MSVYVSVPRLAKKTGAMLQAALADRGFNVVDSPDPVFADAIVCYGKRVDGQLGDVPILNCNTGMLNKYQELQTLNRFGVSTVRFGNSLVDVERQNLRFPLWGRSFRHREGQGIIPVLRAEDLPVYQQAGVDYFTEFSESVGEWRVGMFQGTPVVLYEKVHSYPTAQRGFGRNYKDGWRFVARAFDAVPAPVYAMCRTALAATGLDFAGVDLLQLDAEHFSVLEVNSAPGVMSEKSAWLLGLTDKISDWLEANNGN